MIHLQLLPSTLTVGDSVESILRVQNGEEHACSNLVLEFDLPLSVCLELGRRRIELVRLGAGQDYDHRIVLRALSPGSDWLTITNFSYRDGSGNPRRVHGCAIQIEMSSVPKVSPQPKAELDDGGSEPRSNVLPSVFISYRRSDSQWVASRLAERLRAHFTRQQVFLDNPSIQLGQNFPRRLDAELQICVALLALIGPHWLSVRNAAGERLHATDDFVRHEIAVALSRNILVIPVLFETSMPDPNELPAEIRALAHLQAKTLDPHRFNADVREIVFALRREMSPAKRE